MLLNILGLIVVLFPYYVNFDSPIFNLVILVPLISKFLKLNPPLNKLMMWQDFFRHDTKYMIYVESKSLFFILIN